MTVSTGIPESWNLPLFWAVVDGTKAGNLSESGRALLVGQYNSSVGTAAPNVPVPVGSLALAGGMFGVGSQLYLMVQAFLACNSTQQLWCVPVPDGAGQKAAATITVTAGTASGLLTVYIGGQKVQVSVGSTDTATTIATNLAAAINAIPSLPVTAAATSGVVTVTCNWAGMTGNDINVIPNYLGVYGGEVLPTGLSLAIEHAKATTTAATTTASPTLTFTANTGIPSNVAAGDTVYDVTSSAAIGTVQTVNITTGIVTLTGNASSAVASGDSLSFRSTSANGQLNGGTGEPTFTGAISAIQSLEFDYVAMPFTDAASQAAWAIEYGFGANGRWNYTRQQYGMVLNAVRDTYANLITWGLAQNQPVISTIAVEQDSPTPLFQWSAAYCALAALGFSADPARPLQTLEFLGVLPARLQNRFSQSQLNSLTNSGLAIQATSPDGNPMILREQTQYQLNSFGQSDTAFGLLTVLATLQELLRRMKSAITSKYPRVKLIPDGTKIGPGQAAVTPTDIKAELIAEFSAAEYDGLVSNMAQFKANLIVEIDDQNPNKLNVLWPPQLAGQLRQFNALAQFRLLYPPIVLT